MKTSLRIALAALVLALAALGTGCTVDLEEDFDTEFTVRSPPAGSQAKPSWRVRRFKLKNDPNDADSVELDDAYVTVVAPPGSDLSFINSLDVFLCDDTDPKRCNGLAPEATLTLVATGERFVPGQTTATLKIVHAGDLRPYVVDDRIVLTFVVYPSVWGYAWPEDGVDLKAGVTVTVTAGL